MNPTEIRAPERPEITGTRLAFAVLGYFLGIIAMITLLPFRFELPDRLSLMMQGTPFDMVANVLLFMPPGFLYRLARPLRGDGWSLDVLGLGMLASTLIESAQLFEPVRYASPLDIAANGFGAWAGAWIADLVSLRLRPDSLLVGRLSLEIPLMGFTYLLVPLLWVGSLAATNDVRAFALLLMPGLAGGIVLAWVHRYRLGRPGVVATRSIALAAAAGTLTGVSPGAVQHPIAAAAMVAIVFVFVLLVSRIPASPLRGERRFERPALLSAMPLLGAHMLALAWIARGGGIAPAPDPIAILRVLEFLAAFTVFGYMLAEWRGRIDHTLHTAVRGAVLRTVPVAALIIAVSGRAGPRALLAILACTAAAGFGAALYHLQRAHVRALVARTTDAGTGQTNAERPAA